MNTQHIPLTDLEQNVGQIDGLPRNPRQWTNAEISRLAKSIKETPELLEARGLIVYPYGGKYIILGGNMRFEALKHNKAKEAPCFVLSEGMSADKLKEIVIKDNGAFGSWDYDEIANLWDDLPLVDWGLPVWESAPTIQATEDAAPENHVDGAIAGETEADTIARREREFQDRMAAGEIDTDDPEYLEFVDKFKPKKTTDDCYTPELVYDAVAGWVENEYHVSRAHFVRPFYPGGDYQKENYKPGDIVVDNPPFSIMAEIVRFYTEKGIAFFLFAPHLVILQSKATAVITGVAVTYANGAVVNTSFITSMEPKTRLRSAPTLYAAVKAANDESLKQMRKELPKYTYPPHVLTSPMVAPFSRLGIDFRVERDECCEVKVLDAQRASGKAIYGGGLLLSERVAAERVAAERVAAERVAAERVAAEREKAERWQLSEKEWRIIKGLK